jgi:hypothetical protein
LSGTNGSIRGDKIENVSDLLVEVWRLTTAGVLKRRFGYFFLVLSVLAPSAIVVLPFLNLSGGQIAGAATVLLIAGEGAFVIGIALLGKEMWGRIKALFKRHDDRSLTNKLDDKG